MSLVPSEIDYEDDSDPDRATMRISGFTISVMMSVLAVGFAVVGFLAFQQLPGGAPAHADAPPASINDDRASALDIEASPQQSPDVEDEPVGADAETSPPVDDAPTPAETADMRLVAVEPAPDGPDAPTIKPPSARAPTVVFDPTIIDAETSPPGEGESEIADAPDIGPQTPVVDTPAVTDEPAIETNAPETSEETSDPPSTADNIDATAAVETESPPPSSASTDEPSPPPAAQIPATPVDALAGSHVVQIGSFRSEAEAMADWGRIEGRFEDLLIGKTYNIQSADLGERGVFYRLRIGPFENNDDAQAYCRTLTGRGKACLAVRH